MLTVLRGDDRRAVALSIVFLLLSVALTVGLKRVGITDTALIIALFLIPLVVYGVASGKIREFSAPGGPSLLKPPPSLLTRPRLSWISRPRKWKRSRR